MNIYQEKIEAKRERYAEIAKKKQAESDSRWKAAQTMASMIPFGQPILVGHHSERGHRKALDRITSNRMKSIELEKTATFYENKAESYGTHGISSDNPEAVTLLKEKLAKLQEQREAIKKVSKEMRSRGERMPSFHLTNLGANIRTVQKRIEQLERKATTPETESVEGTGWKMYEDKTENRICFVFPGKPSDEVRAVLKSRGFKWSPTRGAWVRQITNQAQYAAKMVIQTLTK